MAAKTSGPWLRCLVQSFPRCENAWTSSTEHPTTFKPTLLEFDALPDDAIVPDGYAAQLLAISIWTLRRTNPVPPKQISERRRGRRARRRRRRIPS